MPGLRLVFALVCAFPTVSSAQTWADAYRAGDYDKAAALLQAAVSRAAGNPAFDDSDSAEALANMYARGQGVPANPMMACSLARTAGLATQMRIVPGEDVRSGKARLDASEAFVHRHCDPLPHDDRVTADNAVGCFAFGMREETFAFGGQTVRIGRRGISIVGTDAEPWELMGCPQRVARLRTMSIAPPPDAAPDVKPRHFIEIFMWVPGNRDGAQVYSLEWNVYEVRDSRILFFVVAQDVATRPDWPEVGLPAEIEKGLTLEMIPSGHVRWKLEGQPPKRGWIMLGGEVTR
jgi:hypothetical protein